MARSRPDILTHPVNRAVSQLLPCQGLSGHPLKTMFGVRDLEQAGLCLKPAKQENPNPFLNRTVAKDRLPAKPISNVCARNNTNFPDLSYLISMLRAVTVPSLSGADDECWVLRYRPLYTWEGVRFQGTLLSAHNNS